jgi:hypothetical protein
MITVTLPEWCAWVLVIGVWLHLINELLRWYVGHLRAKLAKLEKETND